MQFYKDICNQPDHGIPFLTKSFRFWATAIPEGGEEEDEARHIVCYSSRALTTSMNPSKAIYFPQFCREPK